MEGIGRQPSPLVDAAQECLLLCHFCEAAERPGCSQEIEHLGHPGLDRLADTARLASLTRTDSQHTSNLLASERPPGSHCTPANTDPAADSFTV